MFIGHYGVGFGAKRAAPAVSLGTCFLAAQLLDLLWPTFVLLGIERVRIAPGITKVTPLDFEWYPYSHSLVAALVWSILFATAYAVVRRRAGAALLLGGAVFSHWLLDFVTHRPDLPLGLEAGPRVGLGLWSSWGGTLAVELAIFAAGVALYARGTQPRDRVGRWGLAGLVAFLLLAWGGSLFGPPPPSAKAVAWSAEAMWLLVAWGYWVDRHRRARGA